MTIAIGQEQDRGTFDLIDDWLIKTDLYLLVGLDFYYSHVLTYQLVGFSLVQLS
jgi:hypothetical protein